MATPRKSGVTGRGYWHDPPLGDRHPRPRCRFCRCADRPPAGAGNHPPAPARPTARRISTPGPRSSAAPRVLIWAVPSTGTRPLPNSPPLAAFGCLRGHGLWTVESKAGGEVLGFVLIGFEPGDQEPELGYLFRPAAEGHGYATEAATALRDHAFSTLRMDRLVSYIDPANRRSQRVAERLRAARRRSDGVAGLVASTRWLAEVSGHTETAGRRIDDVQKAAKGGA